MVKRFGNKGIIATAFIFSIIAGSIVNATNVNGYSVSEDGKECTTTMTFTADTADTEAYNPEFEESINLDHKDYVLKDITYDVVSEYNGKYDAVKEEVVVTATVTDAEAVGSDTITQNGFVYELENSDLQETEGEDLYLYKYVYYERQTTTPEYEPSISYDYTDENGKTTTVTLPFESIKKTSDDWSTGNVLDGVVENYDADYWKIGDHIVVSNTNDNLDLSVDDCRTLLSEAGFNPDHYKDFYAYFNGEPYTREDGVVCRAYMLQCSILGASYEVRYSNMISGLKPKWLLTSVYKLSEADKEKIEKAKNTYTVTATAVYSLVEDTKIEAPLVEDNKSSTIKKVVLSATIILLIIIFISLGVYIAKGGRKNTDYRSRRDSIDDYKKM